MNRLNNIQYIASEYNANSINNIRLSSHEVQSDVDLYFNDYDNFPCGYEKVSKVNNNYLTEDIIIKNLQNLFGS